MKISSKIALVLVIILLVIFVFNFFKKDTPHNSPQPQNKVNEEYVDTQHQSKIQIYITKEGEVFIQNEKIDLDSIPSRIEGLKNKFPDGEIIVYKGKDSPSKVVTKVVDLANAEKIINVVVAAKKEK